MSAVRRALATAAALAALAAGLGAAAGPATAVPVSVQSTFDAQLLALVNGARAAHGLPAVTVVPGLADQAADWSDRLRGYRRLVHDPDLGAKAGAACNSTVARENIAYAPSTWTAKQMFDLYMGSAGHRANILASDVRYIGIGTVLGAYPGWPTLQAHWDTMKLVGGRCPVAPSVSGGVSSYPTAASLSASASSVRPGAAFTLTVGLVALPGPSRTGTLWFTPRTTGVARLVGAVTLAQTGPHGTTYRGARVVSQPVSGTWTFRYSGSAPSATTADRASSRSAAVTVRTVIAGFTTTTTRARTGSVLHDGITVTPRYGRTVSLQYRTCAACAWHTVRSVSVPGSTGALTLAIPVRSGTRQGRAYVPAARAGLAAATPPRTVVGV